MNINKVILLGELEHRKKYEDRCEFNLLSKRAERREDRWVERIDTHSCIAEGDDARMINTLRDGARLLVEGRLDRGKVRVTEVLVLPGS